MSMPKWQADLPKTLEESRVWHERQPDVWEFIDGTPRQRNAGSMARVLIKSNVGCGLDGVPLD
jgi:hypothetical protein